MTIKLPDARNIPQLRALWKEAFGDTDAFLNCFFSTAFSPDHSRCIEANGQVTAALYWLDGICSGRKVAYIYAVATAKAMQGQGLCRKLMDAAHTHLAQAGYSGAILVPGDAGLARMYGKMGYRTCTYVQEFSCTAGSTPLVLREASVTEYGRLRTEMLPEGALVQDGVNLDFLATFHDFWVGDGVLLAGRQENGVLHGAELLGDPSCAPGIAAALGCREGHFRTPGQNKPFGMYLPFDNSPAPTYLGFAFD